MENLNNTVINAITEFLNGLTTEVSVNDHVDIENIDFENAYDSIYEMIDNNNGFDIEIIYYSRAIEYLKENDPSLNVSLEIADNLGYSPRNLNSEILASLLASENSRTEFADLESEINDFFSDLLEELEELENEDEEIED